VAAADDDDIEWAREAHGLLDLGSGDEGLRIVGAGVGSAKPGDMSHLSPPSSDRLLRALNTPSLMLALAAALAIAPAAAAPPPSSAMTFAPCQIRDLQGIQVYNAECADFAVPENPANPGGRAIKLRVARVPAINRRKEPDPLFLLAGGPGMAATALYGNAAPVFGRIRRNRDIVLVDQRGTGGSNALNCPTDDLEMMSAKPEDLRDEAQRCLAKLREHADVAYYTTTVAVQDLDRVRAALGYERINLYGGSYGTRVAQHYLRRYPEHTRSVILDGVVAPEQILGPDTALDAENALQSVFARCKQNDACTKQFGDPAEAYRALRKTLETKPVSVTLPDPTTGVPRTIEFGSLHLAMVLRLSIYNSEQAALLPLALNLAQQSGNFAPLAGQFLMTLRTFDEIASYGMHNSVVCTEDVPFFDTVKIDRAKLETTFLGAVQVDALQSICEGWPRGPLDADLHAPLRSDVPVLLLSGGNDPVTPPANGEKAKVGLTNSLHLVLPDLGHGQIGAACMDRVMADFIRLGSVKDLDTSCTKLARPMPFFTSLSGPAP
jgi:pimeloyl-ACP methyl ester carboxylesterase